MKFHSGKGLTYDDIVLVPGYTTLSSRTEADTSLVMSKKFDIALSAPIISSNMDTITGAQMVATLSGNRIGAALHRFWSIDRNVEEYLASGGFKHFVSVGVTPREADRFEALYDAGARMFIVDIAHGDCRLMQEMLTWIREAYGDEVYVVAGNVATEEATRRLVSWGADAIKVGIGGGSICKTRVVTGHGVPNVSSLMLCKHAVKHKVNVHGEKVMIIADGGIRSSGDIVKAIASGADCVMVGSLIAGTDETPGRALLTENGLVKAYRGMASRDVLLEHRAGPESALPASEGVGTTVPAKGPVMGIIRELTGGIRSGMSYCNARTLEELQKNAVAMQQTNAGVREGTPHILG